MTGLQILHVYLSQLLSLSLVGFVSLLVHVALLVYVRNIELFMLLNVCCGVLYIFRLHMLVRFRHVGYCRFL